MEYCSKCFKKLCRCGRPKVEIDYYIYPAIYELNRRGYRTTSCCSGHENGDHISTYISFADEIEENLNSEYFQFDSYNYRGFHERKNCIRLKVEIVKKLKKKRTNKLAIIQEANKDLYMWAKSLPPKRLLDDNGVEFPISYFDQEVESDEVVDVQKPWILFTKTAEGCKYTADDFFNEIECAGELTELVVNGRGQIKRFCGEDYISRKSYTGNASLLKSKIEFDASGDFRYLLFGYEPYIMIEQLRIDESIWHLSYARTDIAIGYGEEDPTYTEIFTEDYDLDDLTEVYPAKFLGDNVAPSYMENLFDEDDIEDFKDEYPDKDELDLFAYLFNRLCRLNINICVFSADNINIIFSNKTDYNLLITKEQNAIAFGEADYEYMDFVRVRVDRKEVSIYANGRLLMRKDVE